MRGKKRIPARVIMTLLMGIIGFFLFGFILTRAQSRLFLINIQEEMIDSADYIVRARSNAGIGGYALENWAQRNRLFFADMIDFMGENDPEFKLDQAHLKDINSLLGTQDIMIVDKSGDVLTSATGRFDSLKGEDYAPLFETFETGEVSRLSVFPWSFSMLQSRAEVLSRDDPRRLRDEAALDGEEGLTQTGADATWIGDAYDGRTRFPVFYALSTDGRTALVFLEDGEDYLMYEDMADAWNNLLSSEVVGKAGFAFAWTGDTGEVLYYPDDAYKLRKVSELGIDRDQIHDREFTWVELEGERIYLYPVYDAEQDAWIACAYPEEEMKAPRVVTTLLLWLIFGVLLSGLTYYAMLLFGHRGEAAGIGFLPHDGRLHSLGRKRRLMVFTLFAAIMVCISSSIWPPRQTDY